MKFKELFWAMGSYPTAPQLYWPKPSEKSKNYKTKFPTFRKEPLIQEIVGVEKFSLLGSLSGLIIKLT